MKALIALVLVSAFVVSCGHKRHKRHWKMMDKDGDGKISKEEYDNHKKTKWEEMDANKDGFVTMEEKKAYKKKKCKEMCSKKK